MSEEELLIGELAHRSGISVRTIRYYISEDLLVAPPVRGRYSRFSSDYIERILLIRRMQDIYLPLKEIRRQMQNLDTDEVRELLEKFEDKHNNLPYPARLPGPVRSSAHKAALMEGGKTWRRIALAPGLELHVELLLLRQYEPYIRQIIELVKRITRA
jgi:DNA-binding transcriptional MerR regulator